VRVDERPPGVTPVAASSRRIRPDYAPRCADSDERAVACQGTTREYEWEYRPVSVSRSLLLLGAASDRARCSHFQLLAEACSYSARTFNPKVAGSIPARPINRSIPCQPGARAAAVRRERNGPSVCAALGCPPSRLGSMGPMPQTAKLSGLGVLFVAGLLLAGAITAGGRAAQPTTTETTVETTTAPGTTESTTVTVQQTTTRRVIVPTTTTTSPENSASTTPTWVWVLLGAVALAAIGLLVAFLTRRGGQRGVSGEERRRRLDGAVASWIAQGWALDNQTADSAVLRRGNEVLLVAVDEAGHVSARPLSQ